VTWVAATPRAWEVCSIDRPSNFETAAAAPMEPVVEVICLKEKMNINKMVQDGRNVRSRGRVTNHPTS